MPQLSPDKVAVVQFLISKQEWWYSSPPAPQLAQNCISGKIYNLRQLGSDSKTSFRKISYMECASGAFDKEGKKNLLTHSFPGCTCRGHCTGLRSRPRCRRYLSPRSAACQKERADANGNEWPGTLGESRITMKDAEEKKHCWSVFKPSHKGE